MKKILSYGVLGVIVLICLLCVLEVFAFFGIFVGIFPLLAYWLRDGIITSEVSYSLFVLAFVLFFAFLAFKKYKALLFNLSLFIFIIGATEKILILSKKDPELKIIESNGYQVISDTLGFRPQGNFKNHSRASFNNKFVYDVWYSTDKFGHRKTPPIDADLSTKSVVFFGCSFTFGVGLNDDEVMPNMVQNLVQNKYKVYNFAAGGYGTHQMLASIENNMVDSIVKYEPKVFIYALIPDHINRMLDLSFFGHHTPKYVLDSHTLEVKYAGHFDDFNNMWKSKIINSELYNRLRKKEANPSDVILFVKTVEKSREILKAKYPNSEFHILFWDNGKVDDIGSLMIKELKNANFPVHLVTEIVPDYFKSMDQYCVKYPYEFHPNGKVNRKIANYIVNNILLTKDTSDHKSIAAK
jgi:hypothetical protein